jgi:outer membrane receptor protein involved in Fe transport
MMNYPGLLFCASPSSRRFRLSLLAAALQVVYPAAAMAQTVQDPVTEPAAPSAPSAAPSAAPMGQVVVTASRVVRSGFSAPTPTTVLNADDFRQKGQTGLGEILNAVPSFKATNSSTTSGPVLTAGRTTPDLRGLGAIRTLVLFDGQRAVPATNTGLTDVNLIPTLLVDRIDVVSGGASAGWGSDAIAGVVNVVLKKRMSGLVGDVMAGSSRYGDSRERRIALAGGTGFLDNRAQIVAGIDVDDNRGVGDQFTRQWGREGYSLYTNGAANGLPQRLLLPNVYVGNATTGGLITGVSGGASSTLKGLAFGPEGSVYAFPFGALTSATQTVGPATADAYSPAANLYLQVPVKRYNGMVRAEMALGDDLSAFVSLLAAGYRASAYTFPNQNAGPTALTIRADNAYLPASVKALMPAGSSISLGRYTTDGVGPPRTDVGNQTYNLAGGLSGDMGMAWKWDANVEVGRNTMTQDSANFLVASKFASAIDAVRDSAGGIVCRSTLTNPGNGCVPYNVFGANAASAPAVTYVHAAQALRQVTRQSAAALTVHGDPFALSAGNVSLAAGVEYRRESVDTDVDPISLANGFVSTNPKPIQGAYTVREAFAETVTPLLKDAPFARALDLDTAVRVTDYSTSGTVKTWKAGLVYVPFSQVKLRATRSLDIRAPNLNELYAVATPGISNTLLNPFLGGTSAGFVSILTSGNTQLKPEKSQGLTYGIVVEPSAALSLSADYYDIHVHDAISSVANQTIINQCHAGNEVLCNLLVRSPSNVITQINQQVVNISSFRSSGVDAQAAFRMVLPNKDKLVLSLNTNYTINAIVSDGVSSPVNRAGELSNNAFSRPHWMSALSATYHGGERWTAGAQLQYVGGGNYDNTYAEGTGGTPAPGGFTINRNRIPSASYLNVNLSYNVFKDKKRALQLYGLINNLADRAPPVAPVGGGSTNPAFYDVIGRVVKAGVRFSY